MRIVKCDKCKKIIKESGLRCDGASGTIFHKKGLLNFDLCDRCALPVLKNIEKHLKIKNK